MIHFCVLFMQERNPSANPERKRRPIIRKTHNSVVRLLSLDISVKLKYSWVTQLLHNIEKLEAQILISDLSCIYPYSH